ncbi:hypothetical protein GDO86_018980 [Hymenochirus boettgeri]|uniref:Uncharacterized protein n=1 Tax=Hymenochirus boettgeri TaxID=247094 RepID=A0A8T2II58_9PIPI|nr:hypothetical protein GDO86_018980 [Hymenochirus boettgeri]
MGGAPPPWGGEKAAGDSRGSRPDVGRASWIIVKSGGDDETSIRGEGGGGEDVCSGILATQMGGGRQARSSGRPRMVRDWAELTFIMGGRNGGGLGRGRRGVHVILRGWHQKRGGGGEAGLSGADVCLPLLSSFLSGGGRRVKGGGWGGEKGGGGCRKNQLGGGGGSGGPSNWAGWGCSEFQGGVAGCWGGRGGGKSAAGGGGGGEGGKIQAGGGGGRGGKKRTGGGGGGGGEPGIDQKKKGRARGGALYKSRAAGTSVKVSAAGAKGGGYRGGGGGGGGKPGGGGGGDASLTFRD